MRDTLDTSDISKVVPKERRDPPNEMLNLGDIHGARSKPLTHQRKENTVAKQNLDVKDINRGDKLKSHARDTSPLDPK